EGARRELDLPVEEADAREHLVEDVLVEADDVEHGELAELLREADLERDRLLRLELVEREDDDALGVAFLRGDVAGIAALLLGEGVLDHLRADEPDGPEVAELEHPVERGQLVEVAVVEVEDGALGDGERDAEARAEPVERGGGRA